MAIVLSGKTDIGQYEYQCDNGAWEKVNVTNTKPLGKVRGGKGQGNGQGQSKDSNFINVIYLKPADKLRFSVDGNKFWTRLESNRKARFVEFISFIH